MQLMGKDAALAQGWTLFHYDCITADHGAWMEFRKRGAVVVDCEWIDDVEMRKRVWTFGLPPDGWVGDLRAVAIAAGMFLDCRDDGYSFRFLRAEPVSPARGLVTSRQG